MASEPDNIVLKLLREMRVILDEHSIAHLEHRASFKALDKKIDNWRLEKAK